MDSLTLLSIQVGKPAAHGADSISDKSWTSGIFKAPVTGPVWLGSLNLEGDGQQDLKNHGGPYRAVLAYSADHYPTWREELNLLDLPYGAFGENFTVTGLDEETVCIGDVYTIGGEVQVEVAQPRKPCWKLARRWGIKDLTDRTHQRAWGGWYNRVLREGYVEAGMPVTRVERPYPQYTVRYVYGLIHGWVDAPDDMARLAELEPLSTDWRDAFASLLA